MINNKLTSENFIARLKEANLANKSNNANFVIFFTELALLQKCRF